MFCGGGGLPRNPALGKGGRPEGPSAGKPLVFPSEERAVRLLPWARFVRQARDGS